jgi:hypothetical protein
MAAEVCRDITEWIEEEISKPVEEWEERQEKRCKEKECNWWTLCLNKLVCWFVTYLVKVVRWVVVTVGKWVTRTVCTAISILVDLTIAVVTGLVDIVVGVVTWDWPRVWDGFVKILGGAIVAVLGAARVVFLIDTIDFIREEWAKAQLRDHVRDLLERRFARDPQALAAALEAIGVDHGAFGLRLKGTATRRYVRSDRVSDGGDGVPDLIRWHEASERGIDIRKLAGYDYDSFWKRGRPEVVGADEDEVDEYIRNRGGRSFRIYPMSESLLENKASVVAERARDLGLLYEFDLHETEVTAPQYVMLTGSSASQDDFNVDVLARHDETVDAASARKELSTPHGGAVFGYTGSFIGFSAHLDDATGVDGSPFPGDDTSGVSFMDRVPDVVFKYVFAHELGHYFGLVHVDGAHRIMYTFNKNEDTSMFTWWTIPELLLLEQQPRFVLDEAKRAWDYIVAGFPTEALTTRAH